MAEIITMPRLSDTMEEGTVATWLKKVGDKVEEGDILAEIETDKATMEFESFYDGTLLHIGIAEGETAEVDKLLAIIGEEGEDISGLLNGQAGEEDNKGGKSDDIQESVKEGPDSTDNDTGADELPEGVEVITMPRLSDTMEEGTVASWLKKEGDKVEEGDILAEIETDKATMEFESFYSGTLLKIGIGEGESAKVDALRPLLARKEPMCPISRLLSPNLPLRKVRRRHLKRRCLLPVRQVEAPVKDTLSAAPTPAESSGTGRIFASPLARKLAEERGISLSTVRGSGENGRIIKRDIENYQPAAAGAHTYVPVGEEQFDEVSNSQMRKTIAKRLGESKFTAPHYYLTIELDMDSAIASRVAINSDPDVKISFNDMILKACAMALRKHPQVNSTWDGNVTRIARHIHMGVAVAVDDGLVVPVLKFADQMTFSQIGATVKELAGKARNKKLTPEEMQGSTFTVSNLGMFGIKEFTSIINQPNSAILSVGAIVQKPVVKNGAIAVGNTMTVTLACDHRTVDGATGAKFLQTLRQYIENPVTMFV